MPDSIMGDDGDEVPTSPKEGEPLPMPTDAAFEVAPDLKKRRTHESSSDSDGSEPDLCVCDLCGQVLRCPPNTNEATLYEQHLEECECLCDIWDHFQKVPKCDGSELDQCVCVYCEQVFECPTTAIGTTSLFRHVEKCDKCPYYKESEDSYSSDDEFDKAAAPHKAYPCNNDTQDLVVPVTDENYDQAAVRKALAMMIILDGLPFSFVERETFISFMKALQPLFTMVPKKTVMKDCIDIFRNERQRLKETLVRLTRICVTVDFWTSIQDVAYMCLTAHYIDNDWKLHRKIVNFHKVLTPDDGEAIADAVESCLSFWGVDNLFTITVDNASSNNVAVWNLKRKFNLENGLLLNGDFFHVHSVAHILNLIVRDAIEEAEDSITRIRNKIMYIRSSPFRMQHFKSYVEEKRIGCKRCLYLDNYNRWDSTYFMLESAIEFRKAFEQFEESAIEFHKAFEQFEEQDADFVDGVEEQDADFVDGVEDAPPSEEDWRVAKVLCTFLKTFYEVNKRLSGSQYVTSNAYFHEVIAIEYWLGEWVKAEDSYLCNMAKRMKEKFDKYWGRIDKINMLLVIAVVLDPCYKLGYVRFWYSQFFENDKVDEIMTEVKVTLERFFLQYKEIEESSDPDLESSDPLADKNMQNKIVNDPAEIIKQKYRNVWIAREHVSEKSELERYLDDALEEETSDFDILHWWKINSSRYCVLAQMARDVLAIPVSTVTLEHAFSTEGKVLDRFRSSLTPTLVECLICAQSWFRTSSDTIGMEENVEELDEIESG